MAIENASEPLISEKKASKSGIEIASDSSSHRIYCKLEDDGENVVVGENNVSESSDELQQFHSSLTWLGLNQSTTFHVVYSWILFVLFTVAVPLLESFTVSCRHCSVEHQHPFQKWVRYSESGLAAVSFICLFLMLRRHGLRNTLLLDKIDGVSSEIQQGYKNKLRVRHHFISLQSHFVMSFICPFGGLVYNHCYRPCHAHLHISVFVVVFLHVYFEADINIVLTVFLYLIVLLTSFIVFVYLCMGHVLYLVQVRERLSLVRRTQYISWYTSPVKLKIDTLPYIIRTIGSLPILSSS